MATGRMLSMESQRFGKFLRRLNADIEHVEYEDDCENLLLERRALLEALVKDLQEKEGSSKRFNWRNFLRDGIEGLEVSNSNLSGPTPEVDEAMRILENKAKLNPQIRQEFREFVQRCVQLSEYNGERLFGKELEEVSKILYDGFNNKTKRFKKKDVENALGNKVSTEDVKEARRLANALAAWIEEIKVKVGLNVNGSKNSLPKLNLNQEQFGHDLNWSEFPENEVSVKEKLEQHGKYEPQHGDEVELIHLIWLLDRCTSHASKTKSHSAQDLYESLQSMIKSTLSNEELQGQLVDLLGFEDGSFQFISELLSKRKDISREIALELQPINSHNATDVSNVAAVAVAATDHSSSFDQLDWLSECCALHVSRLGSSSAISAQDLYNSLLVMLNSSSSNEELQGQLFDLLGFAEDSFELMSGILERRNLIIKESKNKSSTKQSQGMVSAKTTDDYSRRNAYSAADGSKFKAHSQVYELDLDAPAELRGGTGAAARVRLERSGGYVAPPQVGGRVMSRPAGTSEQQMVHTFLTGPGAGSDDQAESKTKYILVHVPPKRIIRDAKADASLFVPISRFGILAQMAFKGIKMLNRIQSYIFHTAYHSNHNLLVCAPTGAGKTNVAMTTVVREIERHQDTDSGKIDTTNIKIIYVAPMKALAQEVVVKFGKRLSGIGIKVRELTGDMQLSKSEIEQTQIIVTTPEKWDVITRKSGDGTLVEQVGLLIIDEVHLVGEDRGPVIESLVARTLRLVEQKQKMVRIVGLSATLPNYKDVARFLRVDPDNGLFFFDNSFRPVPLDQTFIGVKEKSRPKTLAIMNDLAYEHSLKSVLDGNQVMIFVHSRKDTSKTVRGIMEAASATGMLRKFVTEQKTLSMEARDRHSNQVSKSRNAEVREFFDAGFGIHHAGMLRADRTLTETLFEQKAISVLVCTATLAWGVNLPAHTVIIKGTQIYIAEKGGLVELNMQDVFQCFGRAGRPQYDTSGEAILITEYSQLNRYLGMLNHCLPLESHLHKKLPDALNAEIVSGTVTNMEEAVEWLSYTFLYVRMLANPMAYGITQKDKMQDPTLYEERAKLIAHAAKELDRAKMSRFGGAAMMRASMLGSSSPTIPRHAPLGVTDKGRVASHFYIGYGTIEIFNSKLKSQMDDAEILDVLCMSSEFENVKVREEEMAEIQKLKRNCCVIELKQPSDSPRGKCAILLQTFFSRARVNSFTLASDMNYISQNLGRITRAVFQICLNQRWSSMAERMLTICVAVEKRCWWPPYAHPLRQFVPLHLSPEICMKLEVAKKKAALENLLDMTPNEVGHLIRHVRMGEKVIRNARRIPYLDITAYMQPITRSILKVTLEIQPQFDWHDRLHGGIQAFWLWVEDQNSELIYHSERLVLRKGEYKRCMRRLDEEEKQQREEQEKYYGLQTNPDHRSSSNRPSLGNSDNVMCLTMHQPWASLLVHGIKRAEGRNWPTNYRGRLFIHAAAKVPNPETVADVEEQYRTLYEVDGGITPEFPASYPTSCLLGCVEMRACVSQRTFSTMLLSTENDSVEMKQRKESIRLESSSPYVFLCENPQILLIPLHMGGSHKLWRLSKSVLESVTAQGLTEVDSPGPPLFSSMKIPPQELESVFESQVPDDIDDVACYNGNGIGDINTIGGEEEEMQKSLYERIVEKRRGGTHPAFMNADELTSSSLVREFNIPIFEPLPPQYYVRVVSDSWLGSELVVPLSLRSLVLPPKVRLHTDLLDLTPLPLSALRNPAFENLYMHKFTHFNPIQTQIFHTLYHTSHNVLLGAPTGSGKTISSELAILRVFNAHPGKKTVYIAPLKALVSERIVGWKKSFGEKLGKVIVELTGDVTPDSRVLQNADIIITTPEKWDGITRKWQKTSYVKSVALLIIDEIHLLGEERGAILEVIVTRMRYISEHLKVPLRVVGLSTALANASDLANWLGIENGMGLFNFRPAVRPVPLEAHIHGFPGQHYCPRMATMNKPAYQAIITHSKEKPVLIFVASRRQTRLTALDLISLCAGSSSPRQFLHMFEDDLDAIIQNRVKDDTLAHTLAFGIGIHHAGLPASDRDVVENLFVSGKIQVLVCTSTLAWGVNFPAHLVIIKGTEYYDARTKRYQPFPVTDVLQMMGRAGRPQYDDDAVAMIFVQDTLKDFYKKFLYEPFPVESHLPEFLHNHINAEISSGSINSRRDAVQYLGWTYFFRRLPKNPSYYNLNDNSIDCVADYLVELVDNILFDLQRCSCIQFTQVENVLQLGKNEGKWASKTQVILPVQGKSKAGKNRIEDVRIVPTYLCHIASYYYLDYTTVNLFKKAFVAPRDSYFYGFLREDDEEARLFTLAKLLSDASEYSEVPVRHNEELINAELSKLLPWELTGPLEASFESPHAKTFLLLQAHWKHVQMPIKDYVNDTKSVLDQAPRVVNAMVEVAAKMGLLRQTLSVMRISQLIAQARWWDDPSLMQIPYVTHDIALKVELLWKKQLQRDGKSLKLLDLVKMNPSDVENLLKNAGLRNAKHRNAAGLAIRRTPYIRLVSAECSFTETKMSHIATETDNPGLKESIAYKKVVTVVFKNDTSSNVDLPFCSSHVKSKKLSCWVVLTKGEDRLVELQSVVIGRNETERKFTLDVEAVVPTHVHLVFSNIIGLDVTLPITLQTNM